MTTVPRMLRHTTVVSGIPVPYRMRFSLLSYGNSSVTVTIHNYSIGKILIGGIGATSKYPRIER
jgi:hypothetical protein